MALAMGTFSADAYEVPLLEFLVIALTPLLWEEHTS